MAFARLVQMCRVDCANTLYKFCGKVNWRRFGVPMEGYIPPALAILCCAMIEYDMGHLGELVGIPLDLWFDTMSWMMCLACMMRVMMLSRSW